MRAPSYILEGFERRSITTPVDYAINNPVIGTSRSPAGDLNIMSIHTYPRVFCTCSSVSVSLSCEHLSQLLVRPVSARLIVLQNPLTPAILLPRFSILQTTAHVGMFCASWRNFRGILTAFMLRVC